MDARARGRESFTHLPRDGSKIGRLPNAHELHSRRTAADHGASFLWFVGISDDGIFRAHLALWHAARFHVFRGLPAPARHRRDSRLGAIAFSVRRTWARILRWNPSFRTCRLAQRISS